MFYATISLLTHTCSCFISIHAYIPMQHDVCLCQDDYDIILCSVSIYVRKFTMMTHYAHVLYISEILSLCFCSNPGMLDMVPAIVSPSLTCIQFNFHPVLLEFTWFLLNEQSLAPTPGLANSSKGEVQVNFSLKIFCTSLHFVPIWLLMTQLAKKDKQGENFLLLFYINKKTQEKKDFLSQRHASSLFIFQKIQNPKKAFSHLDRCEIILHDRFSYNLKVLHSMFCHYQTF